MKNIRLYLLLIAVLLWLCFSSACSTEKSFYQRGSGFDYLRFPLLEPYYVMYMTEELGWGIALHGEPSTRNFLHYLYLQDVSKIAVENGVIMAYTPYTKQIALDNGQKSELHWFILIPDQIELGFETEEDFRNKLVQYDIHEPAWQDPKSILQQFDRTRCLDWIPECQ
jgi:hypothetical protein